MNAIHHIAMIHMTVRLGVRILVHIIGKVTTISRSADIRKSVRNDNVIGAHVIDSLYFRMSWGVSL